MKKSAKSEQKKGPWKKILIAVIIILILGLATAVGIVYWKLSQIGEVKPSGTITPGNESFETDEPQASAPVEVAPDDVVWPEGVQAVTDKDVFNILLIGQDKRPNETANQRSDTMIIVSYNKNDGTVKLVSLMRDLYVQIPGYSDNRLNAAFTFGGMDLLDSTIEQDFGISIDGNMEVDFEGFANIIDSLGGVDITINRDEAVYMQDAGYDVSEGLNHMDGKTALCYARIRHVGDADFERTQRQRTLLTQIAGDVGALSTAKKIATVDKLLPYLSSDLSETEILSYVYTVLKDGYNGIESYRIPGDGTYQSVNIRGMSVLLPDLDANRELLKQYIYGG
jgi:LCP family protein required for cell wall assembly